MKSRELLERAKKCANGSRDVSSQVEMSEGSLFALNGRNDLACQKFASVKSEYSDLLALPENEDFAVELDSRLACALVDIGKHDEAIQLFRGLFRREEIDDKQRLLLFFGVALLHTGNLSEAQPLLFEAMKGPDGALVETASEWLARAGKASLKA